MNRTAFWYPDAPHSASFRIAQALEDGGDGWKAEMFTGKPQAPGSVATYGILHGGTEVIRAAEADKRDFWYVDHGYFGRSSSVDRTDGYYRIVRNDLQHTVFGGPGGAPAVSGASERRLGRIGRPLAPRRDPASGTHVVLVPPSHHQWRFYSPQVLHPDRWTDAWRAHVERKFAKPALVCTKGGPVNLEDALDSASLVIGFNSTALIEAAARGIMVESTGPSPLFHLKSWYGRSQWEDVRWALFCEMAMRQFTLAEIRSGEAMSTLKEIGECPTA